MLFEGKFKAFIQIGYVVTFTAIVLEKTSLHHKPVRKQELKF
jgi:hypothetical protein